MLEEMMNARQAEMRVAARAIYQRMEYHQLSRIERLERALRSARDRVAGFRNTTPVKA